MRSTGGRQSCLVSVDLKVEALASQAPPPFSLVHDVVAPAL